MKKETQIEVIDGEKIPYFINGNGERHYRAKTEKQNPIIINQIFKDYNQKYSFVRCGKEMRVVWFSPQSVGYGQEQKQWLTLTKMTQAGFLQAHNNNQWSMAKRVEGNLKHEQKAQSVCWLNHFNLTIYRGGIVFKPEKYCLEDELNLWHGLNLNGKSGNWSLIRKHFLEVICDNHEAHLNYLLDWLAHLYQKPFEKLGVSLVLRSPEKGTGKGSLVDIISKPITDYYLPLNSSKQLTGQFNSHMDGKLLLFADEAVWGGDKKVEGALYTLISETLIPSEAKHEDIIAMANYSRVVMATNNDWVVPAGHQERRFFVLYVSAHRVGDKDYFKALRKEAFEQGGIEAMLYDLLQRPIDSDNLRKPPVTEGLKQQYSHGMGNIEAYLVSCLEEGTIHYVFSGFGDSGKEWKNEPMEVGKKEFYDGFILYCRELQRQRIETQRQFGMKLKKLIKEIKDSKMKKNNRQYNSYILPALDEARKLLSKQVGIELF